MYVNLIFKYIYSLKRIDQSFIYIYYMYKGCTEMMQNVSEVMDQFIEHFKIRINAFHNCITPTEHKGHNPFICV